MRFRMIRKAKVYAVPAAGAAPRDFLERLGTMGTVSMIRVPCPNEVSTPSCAPKASQR